MTVLILLASLFGVHSPVVLPPLGCPMFDVRCLHSKIPYSTGICCIFPKKQLSPHSALMGGQFPVKKSHVTSKNPIFYAGKIFSISPKIELSFSMVKKTSFYTIFQRKCAESPKNCEEPFFAQEAPLHVFVC